MVWTFSGCQSFCIAVGTRAARKSHALKPSIWVYRWSFNSRAQYDLGLMAKRKGEHERAAELWHEILADSADAIQACEQLAINYEKHVKDYERALEYAHCACRLLRKQASQTNLFARGGFARREDLSMKRIKRLEGRLTKRSGKRLALTEASTSTV